MESFFASMKREELYRTKYRSEQELRAAVTEYIKFYNESRLHAKKEPNGLLFAQWFLRHMHKAMGESGEKRSISLCPSYKAGYERTRCR